MRRLVGVLLVLLLLVTLIGCSATDRSNDEGVGEAPPSAPQPDFGRGESPTEPGYDYDDKANGPDGRAGESQYEIRNADLTLDVEELDEVLTSIQEIVRGAGGFIANSSVWGVNEARRATISLRVPAGQMDTLLSDLEALGRRVERSTGRQDVTLYYVDLEARIKNLERQEERLLEILDKAETVDDILRVEQEIARVRGQLESMIAEFRYLRDRVDYATINLNLRETTTASPTITGTGLKVVWQRGVAGLVRTVNQMLTGFGNLLVSLITLLPFIILIVILAVIFSRWLRRAHKEEGKTENKE